jgi:ligand-binding SRPBCC domain-containing protein
LRNEWRVKMVSVCPIATIHASSERVWNFLSEPSNYAVWWDAQTRSIIPQGPAQPGQKIYAETTALGKQWSVTVIVEKVNNVERKIDLITMLPFGITVHNHIICVPLDNGDCHVSFG